MPYGNAAGYDGYMGRWSQKLAPSFARFACLSIPRGIFLDVGCGTGSLLQALAAEFPDGRLFGLDPYVDYLAFAARKPGLGQAALLAGDVEMLPFADAAFDHCLSLLVLQDVRDQGRALGEMRRVTRRGGIVAACQWDFAHGMPMIAAVHQAVEAVAPELYRSSRNKVGRPFETLTELQQRWASAGLAEIEAAYLPVALPFADFADFWLPVLSASTPTTALVAELPTNAREAVRVHLRRALLGQRHDGSFSLTAHAFAIRGRVAKLSLA
jgi:ubiquinone/menaquinone biosynthesis C-methylase UbiE